MSFSLRLANLTFKRPQGSLVFTNIWTLFAEEVYFGKAKDIVSDLRSELLSIISLQHHYITSAPGLDFISFC